MRTSQLLATLFAVSLASASSFDSLHDIKAAGRLGNAYHRRQDNNNNNNNDDKKTTDAKDAATTDKPQATATGDQGTSKPTSGGKPDTTGTVKQSDKPSGTRSGSKVTKTPDPRLPAGGINMITPSAIAQASYYKIGDWITFAWNYTSLEVSPTAINVIASCTKNQATYTLLSNESIKETNSVLWDTGAYQKTASIPLLTETYKLIVYDAESNPTAVAGAGYLGTNSQPSFVMYSPQPSVALADYQCPTCESGAMFSASERQTLWVMFTVATITVLSFTWFSSGFGVI